VADTRQKQFFLKKLFGNRQRFFFEKFLILFFFKKKLSLCQVRALGKGLVTLPSATLALGKAGLC
jgi:hypothetical protein